MHGGLVRTFALSYTQIMIQLTRYPNLTVVELEDSYNSLDEQALDELGGLLLMEATLIDPPYMVVDLSKTDYIGSLFIEILVRAWKRLAERGGHLALCGLHPFCAEVLRISRLDTLWPFFPDVATAIRTMEAGTQGDDRLVGNSR